MSWWNSNPKQDNGKSPAELSKNISQPVTEMIRRIDEEDRVTISPILPGETTSWYVDFMAANECEHSRLVVGWYYPDPEGKYDMIVSHTWPTKAEESALVKAVKRCVARTDSARKLTEREEWCKLMGVSK